MVKSKYPEGQRSVTRLLEEYDNQSLEALKDVLNERDYKRLMVARSIRTQLAAAVGNPKDEREVKERLMRDLMGPEESLMGLGVGELRAGRIIREIYNQLAEATKMTRSVHRMIVARRNEMLYEKGLEKGDTDVMDKAINNDIKLFQLDKEDETKITLEDVKVAALMATLRWNDVMPGQGIDDVDEAIEKVRGKALYGVIELKQNKQGVWEQEDFADLPKRNKDLYDGEEDQSILSE